MNKSVKKLLTALALTALLLSAALSGCAKDQQQAASPTDNTATEPAAESGDTIHIAIVQPMSHTSLDQIRDTIISELQASGKTNLEIDTQTPTAIPPLWPPSCKRAV